MTQAQAPITSPVIAPPVIATPHITLVAPNVSRNMGGEAVKALAIARGMKAMGLDVTQVTHARVRDELTISDPDLDVRFVEDDWTQFWAWKLRLHPLLALLNAWQLHRVAVKVAKERASLLIHYTAPISPVLPYFSARRALPGVPVVIGPLNGAIYHPPAFAVRELPGKRIGRLLVRPMQWLLGAVFAGKREAAVLLNSGAARTRHVLKLGGVADDKILDTLDAGVDPELFERPLPTHDGEAAFVFAGRLVAYKGCDLAIRAVAQVSRARLDIIGDGPERARLEALIAELGVGDRVRFLGWFPYGPALFDRFASYRGFLFPSMAEANGIVIQEAMAMGLPVIALDWGGPASLLDKNCAMLIAPVGERAVIDGLAEAISALSSDAGLARRLGHNARTAAIRSGFSWPKLLSCWLAVYKRVLRSEQRDRLNELGVGE